MLASPLHAFKSNLTAILLAGLLVSACGGGGGGDGSSGGGGVPPDSETGLDARPSNITCVAPERPDAGGGYRLARVFSGIRLQNPLWAGQPPGDPSRWFVAEQGGRIVSFPNSPTASASTTVLTIPIVNPPSEGGLLGFAFAPDFASSGEAYVSYTRNVNANGVALQSVVSRFTSADGGQTLNPASEQEVLVIDKPFGNHNGGNIIFGPDGYLYLGMGDGGGYSDPGNNAQNTSNLLGTIIRIDVSGGGAGYAIPSSNPFAANPKCIQGYGTAACPEIFAWGLRNPWRWSFDRATGDLWAGDVGNSMREEVDIIQRGGNYGWRIREGTLCLNLNDGTTPLPSCQTAGLIDPVVDYQTGVDGNAVTGGYVYRGQQLPELQGRYIFADAYNSSVWTLEDDGNGNYSIVDLIPNTTYFIASFAESLDGELFVLDLGGGGIYQLVADGSGGANTIPSLLSETGCVNPNDPTQPASGLIPFEPGAPFWSDDAAKERWLALPNGTAITVSADDDFIFPQGSVLVKNFRRQGRLIETRLLMRHPDGIWGGYTYRWRDDQRDADRVVGGLTVQAGGAPWIYPSEADCLECHKAATNRALGPEIAQLNNSLIYPQTGRSANQLATLDAIGLLSPRLPALPDELPALPDPFGTAPLPERARAYLHTNCSGCHRPGTGLPSAMDLRYETALPNTNACNADPVSGSSLGILNAKLIAPGDAGRSLIPQRMSLRDANQMPPLGSLVPDTAGVNLINDWIDSLNSCD